MGQLSVLRNRGFLLLWLDEILSQLADRVFVYVLIILAFELTKTNLGISLPYISFGLPALLFSAWAGHIADTYNRKRIILFSDILRGILVIGLVLVGYESLLLIFLIPFVVYTVSQFFSTAELSAIPDLVAREDRPAANSLFFIGWIAASIVGFGAGAFLINFFSVNVVLFISAGLHLSSSAAAFFMPFPPKAVEPPADIKTFWEGTLFSLEFLRRNVLVRILLIKMAVMTSAISVISMLALNYSREVLGLGTKNFGYLVIVLGAGILFGVFLLLRFMGDTKKAPLILSGFVLSGGIIIVLSQVASLIPALCLLLFLGFASVMINVPLQTLLQNKIPEVIRGRIYGLYNMLINLSFTVPVVIFGQVADMVGVQQAMLILGIILLFMGTFGVFEKKFLAA